MNQKELNEIRRRFRLDRNSISRVYGCYVNCNKEIVSKFDISLGLMSEEEQTMYLGLMKRALSGALGKNLVDIEFATRQVADSPEHQLLQTLRKSALADGRALAQMYDRIIQAMDMGDQNYLILMVGDTYDVPHKGRDGETFSDGSDQVYQYILCSICPVKGSAMELRYYHENNEFHGCPTGSTVSNPDLGFLFPAFDDRAANIYNALYYCRKPEMMHQEVIDAVFNVDPPMSAVEQRNIFDTALCETLDADCSYDVVQSVHEQIRGRIADHKESGDPNQLQMSIHEVGEILANSGVDADKVEAFGAACKKEYGEDAELIPGNIVEAKKFEVTTPEIKISVAPENSYLIETRVINGRKYLMIPADSGVEVNGISVTIPAD